MVADEERRMISKRTKEALAAAKARGVQLGGNRGAVISAHAREVSRRARREASEARATDLAPVIADLQAAGVTSLGGLARGLNERGIPTARGGMKWTPGTPQSSSGPRTAGASRSSSSTAARSCPWRGWPMDGWPAAAGTPQSSSGLL